MDPYLMETSDSIIGSMSPYIVIALSYHPTISNILYIVLAQIDMTALIQQFELLIVNTANGQKLSRIALNTTFGIHQGCKVQISSKLFYLQWPDHISLFMIQSGYMVDPDPIYDQPKTSLITGAIDNNVFYYASGAFLQIRRYLDSGMQQSKYSFSSIPNLSYVKFINSYEGSIKVGTHHNLSAFVIYSFVCGSCSGTGSINFTTIFSFPTSSVVIDNIDLQQSPLGVMQNEGNDFWLFTNAQAMLFHFEPFINSSVSTQYEYNSSKDYFNFNNEGFNNYTASKQQIIFYNTDSDIIQRRRFDNSQFLDYSLSGVSQMFSMTNQNSKQFAFATELYFSQIVVLMEIKKECESTYEVILQDDYYCNCTQFYQNGHCSLKDNRSGQDNKLPIFAMVATVGGAAIVIGVVIFFIYKKFFAKIIKPNRTPWKYDHIDLVSFQV